MYMSNMYHTESALGRNQRQSENATWEDILRRLANLQRQINILAGDNEVDELIQRITDTLNNADVTLADLRIALNDTQQLIDAMTKATTDATNAAGTANQAASIAVQIIAELTLLQTDLKQLQASLTQSITDANQATTDANTATDNANQATRDAEQAKTDADNAASRANDAADAIEGWTGAVKWVAGTYNRNNIVTHGGNTYQAKMDDVTSAPPTNPAVENADWIVLALKGVDGQGAVQTVNGQSPGQDGDVEVAISDIDGLQDSLNEKASDADLTTLEQTVTTHLDDYNQQIPKKMDKGAWYIDVKDFGASGDGVTDDTKAINDAINSLPVGTFGGGTVIIPDGNYKISSPILLKNGVTLLGVSPQATRIFAKSNDFTLIMADKSSRVEIKNLMLDGAGFTGIYGVTISNSIGCKVENVWIDSSTRGIDTINSYYLYFESVRIMGTLTGYNFGNASNVINMKNCYSVTTQKAMNWLGSSTLNVAGCSFEGKGLVTLKNVQGASFNACYWEGLHEEDDISTFVEVGGAVGDIAKGIIFSGNYFLIKAQYGISLLSCEGVSINGNYFGTSVAGINVYQYDNVPKRDINIGSNSYDIGNLGHDISKAIAYVGGDFNSLNCNFNSTQLQPLMFIKQKTPQDVTIENDAAVVYWEGQDLKLKIKNAAGVVTTKTFTLS